MVKAIFCGDGTLLIQCAEVFKSAGGAIEGVITSNPRILSWAKQASLPHLGTVESPANNLPKVDYFFSVANLKFVEQSVLDCAGLAAINFHDAPLPAYSGLNAATWALLNGETEHAVTWHEMTEDIDAGRIFKTRSFEVEPTATSFDINSSCYEAGVESFRELVEDIFANRVAPVTQSGERRMFYASERPANLGVIDPGASAEDIARLVHALNFGPARNPMCLAKLWTGTNLVAVSTAEISDAEGSQPGVVAAVSDETVTIGTGDANLVLGGFSDFDGNAPTVADLGLSAGSKVAPFPALSEQETQSAGKSEAKWTSILENAVAAMPPHPSAKITGDSYDVAPLSGTASDKGRLATVWLAWTSALNGSDAGTVSLAVRSSSPVFSNMLPITCGDIGGQSPADLIKTVESTIGKALERGPMARDLAIRLEDADARERAKKALSVCVADTMDDIGNANPGIVICASPMQIAFRKGLYTAEIQSAIASQFSDFLGRFETHSGAISNLSLAPATAAASLASIDDPFDATSTVHQLFSVKAAERPDAVALEAGSTKLTYRELDERSDRLASTLQSRGAAPGKFVGVCLERTTDLIVSLIAVLKTGAAYLPLDPQYPQDRIAFMIEDSEADLILASDATAATFDLDPIRTVRPNDLTTGDFTSTGSPDDLAYLIYTSGSTGKPKGVMVTHSNVSNFLSGMDRVVPLDDQSRLLAVTSVSFDISVLEVFWTLTRGATVVLQTDVAADNDLPAFSLFYFASEAAGSGHHAYRLLLEGAKFADENGFEAIWNPERHFHAFGGLYPNPAVSLASVAGFTKNVKLRGGSCVLPLHHPVRAAEDWSLVDNLSNGRAGIALASGWQPNDFILQPNNFANRKEIMVEGVQTLRKLWRGEKASFPGHDGNDVEVEIHPRPVQKEIPLWITAAGNPETFAAAAQQGCGVLTHLLGQTFEEVAEKIKAYRMGWKEAGHPGSGTVTLMLHTFVGGSDEFVRDTVREPMKGYLKSATDLIKRASWSFPTFKNKAESTGMNPQEIFEKQELSDDEMDALLTHAFERYYQTSGLFGTVESAKEIVRNVAAIGVDEIACLIDFGVDTDLALENLPNIKALMTALEEEGGVGRVASVPELIVENDVTHLQCTPSMASFIAADENGKSALEKLDVLMVGGEALPPELAKSVRASLQGTFLNMYGPTETTIWSSVAKLDSVGDSVPLGAAISNTILSVRTESGQPVPDYVAGELWIGGEGVTKGYFKRPDLTAERFVETPDGTFYRTGDLVRTHPDGTLEFLGRIDNQVKVSGYRIELGEIEAAIAACDGVQDAVVTAFDFGEGDKRLVGYVTSSKSGEIDPKGIRQSIGARLPDFMVPSQIIPLNAMPLTPNGKVDRKALPSPFEAKTAAPKEVVSGDMEEAIAAVWKQALGVNEVSVNDNFFDLGGHSILVVQVQRQLKERLKKDIAITDVFRFSTIRSLAQHLSDDVPKKPSAKNRGAARAAARLARMGRR